MVYSVYQYKFGTNFSLSRRNIITDTIGTRRLSVGDNALTCLKVKQIVRLAARDGENDA